jgi:integrase
MMKMTTPTKTPGMQVARSGADPGAPDAPPLRFTDNYLKTLKPEPGKREKIVFERSSSGLGVRVSASNVSFIVQLRLEDGSRWRSVLGQWGSKLTVEAARKAVQALAGDIARGVDPRLKRREAEARAKAEAEEAEANRLTVRVLLDLWRKKHLVPNRAPGYAKRAASSVERHFRGLLHRPAGSITKKEVRDALGRVTGPGAARQAATSLVSLLRWAMTEDYLSANPIEGFALPSLSPPRERTLDADEARRVFAAASRLPYPAGPYIRLLMLTAGRRAEIAQLLWTEVKDGDGGDGPAIELPAGRTKTGNGHRIPLAPAALDALTECKRHSVVGCKFVFSSDGWRAINDFDRLKKRLDEEVGGRPLPHWRLHDFRRTVVSTLAAMGYDPVVIDLLLGHAPSKLSPVARIYQKFDHAPTRRKALEDWAAFLTQPGAEIVALDARSHAAKQQKTK